jgi:hypothetical protein
MIKARDLLTLALALTVVLTVVTPVPPVRSDDMNVQGVLDRWASSLGGRERLDSAKTVHLRTNVKIFSMDGTVEEWSAADGRHHQTVDVGGLFHVETAFDGDKGWMLDQNGKVSPMSGADLRLDVFRRDPVPRHVHPEHGRPAVRHLRGVD